MLKADDPIAIVGIGCRFPGGVVDPSSFWKLLKDGVDAIREVPNRRWSVEQFYHPNPQVLGTTYSKWGGFIDDIDLFEPGAFGISPREAQSMDPQQRMMLEVTMEALEDAGLDPAALRGSKTGVFAGVSTWDYSQLLFESGSRIRVDPYSATGTALSIVANRISYCFDFHGPSMVVDTACSSSLVAVHLACESIRSGGCGAAVAGGANLFLSPANAIAFSKMGVLSPDGRCKAFDASANGFVRAEGAGVVVLKPLSSALLNCDRVYAVIRATGVNQDGVTNGLAVPNGQAQAALIRETIARARLDPRQVAYVEAHGTGTAVGDPTEAHAIGETIGRGRSGGRCLIGSVKTNIGHLESGAGIAGLIKTALVLEHGLVPPSLHFKTPNPHVDLAALGLEVATENRPLVGADDPVPPLALVNSFGFGGTNALAVLSPCPEDVSAPESIAVDPGPDGNRLQLIPLSAASEAGLGALLDSWATFLPDAGNLKDIGHTAARRRGHKAHRFCVVAADRVEAAERIKAFRTGERTAGVASGTAAARNEALKPVFVFSGQGPQWFAMGRGLYESNIVYRRKIDECDRIIRDIAGWSLVEALSAPEASTRIRETAIAQPALCALQIALADVWRSRGITPAATIGHSVGELAAAHVAGRLTLEETMRIVWHRGDCIERFARRGAMLAAAMPSARAEELADSAEYREIAIAAFNSPASVTFGGDSERLAKLGGRLEQEGIRHQFLQVDYAFHTGLMDGVQEPFLSAIGETSAQAGSIPWMATATPGYLAREELNAGYWWRNVRQPVRFAQTMDALLAEGFDAFLEVSPHPVLLPSITECFRSRLQEPKVAFSLRRNEDEPTTMLANLGLLHCWGCEVDWQSLYPGQRPPATLPRHPWLRESFWCTGTDGHRPWLEALSHPILGSRVESHKPLWRTQIDLHRLPFLAEHRLQNRALLPATAYLDMAMAAAHEVLGVERPVIERVELRKALFLPPEPDTAELLVEYEPADRELRFFSRLCGSQADWTLHCRMRLGGDAGEAAIPRFDREAAIGRCPDSFPGEIVYEIGEVSLFDYRTSFRGLKHFWRSSREVVARIELPPGLEPSGDGYFFHPACLDACIQAGNLNRPFGRDSRNLQPVTFVPVGVGDMRLFQKPVSRVLWAHVVKTRDTARHQCGDITIYDDDGNAVLAFRGFESQGMERRGAGDGTSIDDWTCHLAFIPKVRASEGSGRRRRVPWPAMPEPARELSGSTQDTLKGPARTARHDVLYAKLDELALAWWARAFRALGFPRDGGPASSLAAVIDECGIAGPQARYAEFALTSLVKEGVLTAASGVWRLAEGPALRGDPSVLWREILAEFPVASAELMALHLLGSNLPGLLTGHVTLPELLRNRAAEGLLDQLSQDSVRMIAANAAVAKTVARLAKAAPGSGKVRMLDIGAGFGGITSHILPLLESGDVEYVFTDVCAGSPAPARRRHVDYSSFVDYRPLDLERDPASQGFAPGEFDIIVAANALHAIPDISRSMRRIRQLIAPGGCLCLLEMVTASPWLQFIFGLTPGWWTHQGERMQPLGRLEWRRYLEAEFPEVVDLSDGSNEASSTPVQDAVFLARTADAGGDERTTAQPAQKIQNASVRNCLILADRQHVAESLAGQLAEQGASSRLLKAECGPGRIADEIAAGIASGNPYDTVVILWPLDCTANADLSIESIDRDAPLTWEAALSLVQKISDVESALRPRIFGVTSGVEPVDGAIGPRGLSQSTLGGVLSAAVCEYPGLSVCHVDLDPERPPVSQAREILLEMTSGEPEQEVAFRGGTRFVARIRRTALGETADEEKVRLTERLGRPLPRFELYAPGSGGIDRLSWRETREPPLRSGQIEVRVAAAGLNFRDVLKVLGLYPLDGDYMSLGDECAGIVERVADGVTEFQAGDEVICVGSSCHASHVVTFEHLTMPKPAHVTFEAAATLPIAFLTAHYCLNELARLQPGEWVLIHAAAGGVGLAAVQIAQQAGARIIATASLWKQPFLELLGVEHVLDSRSLDFAEKTRAITGGRGVDVVLNSLSGEAIDKSLSALAPSGRFIEIGKRDLYENRRIGLGHFQQGISFQSVDLSRVMADRPDLIRRMRRELIACFQTGTLRPLPHRVVGAERIRDAFRAMAEAKHFGKIVISMAPPQLRIEPAAPETAPFRKEATYLITGGCGGFGAEIARAMLVHGAQNIVLLGRSDPSSDKVARALARLASFDGTRVTMLQADVADREAMAGVFSTIRETFPPLRGVVHAAGLLEDGPLVQLSPASFRRVIAPKVFGLWNLHEFTRELDLDFLSITSSTASLLGNAGQANYAAANAFMDAFAHYRRMNGLPANAVNFGPLADAGMVARDSGVTNRMARLGVSMLPVRRAIEILLASGLRNRPQIGAVRVRWRHWLDAVGFTEVPSKILDVVHEDDANTSRDASSSGLLESLQEAAPEQRAAMVTQYVALSVARVLGTPPDRIDPAQSLQTLGLDSLSTVELCVRLESDLRITLPLSELAKKPSLAQLSAVVLQLLPQRGPASA